MLNTCGNEGPCFSAWLVLALAWSGGWSSGGLPRPMGQEGLELPVEVQQRLFTHLSQRPFLWWGETAFPESWAPREVRSFSSSTNISCSHEAPGEGSLVFAQVAVFIVREGLGCVPAP